MKGSKNFNPFHLLDLNVMREHSSSFFIRKCKRIFERNFEVIISIHGHLIIYDQFLQLFCQAKCDPSNNIKKSPNVCSRKEIIHEISRSFPQQKSSWIERVEGT